MKRIGILAPDSQSYARIRRLTEELGVTEITNLVKSTMEAGLSMALKMEQEGVDVIVARGPTVDLLRAAALHTPVVGISLSIHDFCRMLHNSVRLTGLSRPKIGFLGYGDLQLDLQTTSSVLNADIYNYPSGIAQQSILAAVRKAQEDKMDIIVGGISAQKALAFSGTPFLQYESNESSLLQALLEAKRIAYARSLERKQALRFKAVVERSSDGIMLLSPKGDILTSNPAAMRILRLRLNPEGLNVKDIFPMPDLEPALLRGQPVDAEVLNLNGQSLLVSLAPILNNKVLEGAVLSIQRSTHIVEMEAKIRRSRAANGMIAEYSFSDIQGKSEAIKAACNVAKRYAASMDTVLLQGESGTGKELFAQAIHNASPNKWGPFVPVNCAALPPTLLESELFGYEAGAFTGANPKGKTGLFELAHQGTLFLDEVACIDHYGQSRMLRVLQDKSILRLGGGRYSSLDFRLIAASNVDLWQLVLEGKFRQDLFYRLHVLPLELPPLRERHGDIVYLAELFVARYSPPGKPIRLTQDAHAPLKNHPWPGNVRELELCLRRLCLTCNGSLITARQVEQALTRTPGLPGAAPPAFPAAPANASVLEAERNQIRDALRASDGNQKRAAMLLGINASTLYRKMKRLGIRKNI